MNRERLKTLRDHLAGLPDERVNLNFVRRETECGTIACIAGWAGWLAQSAGDAEPHRYFGMDEAADWLGLNVEQRYELFLEGIGTTSADRHRQTAIAAIDSMLANPDDDALPVWPEQDEV